MVERPCGAGPRSWKTRLIAAQPMDDAREVEGLWSSARPDDLRRIADLTRRLFAVPAVSIASADPDRVRHVSGEIDDALAVCDVPLLIEGATQPYIGSLRLHGARDWSEGERATLDDLAACLGKLIESRHAAAEHGTRIEAPTPPSLAAQSFRPAEAAVASDPAADTGAGTESGTEAGARILLADDLDLNR